MPDEKKYLDSNGVAYLWEKIKGQDANKVDKEVGKGLSSNDYTSEEKTKLANIASGAQVNVLEGIQVAGQSVTPTNKIANIPAMGAASSSAAGTAGVVPAPAAGNQNKYLRGDGTWQTPEGLSENNFTDAYKNKLDGIEANAQVNTVTSVAGKTGVVTLDASDVGALADDTFIPEASTVNPSMDGTAAIGSSTDYAKADHVHPSDTSKVSTSTTVNGKALTGNITLTASDVGALDDSVAVPDPTTTSPKMDGTAAVGVETKYARGDHVHPSDTSRVPITTTINGKQLNGNISLTASDVGALSDSTSIPTATTTSPKMDGTAAVGTETKFAKGDHVHPTDTSRAPIASPALTGTPTAPTATAGTNSTQIATTAFVASAIESAQIGAAMFQGTVNTSSDISGLTAYSKGWYWVVATAGTYAGQTCEIGDMIFAINDFNTSYKASDFSVIQNNLNIVPITNAEIDTICV